MARSPVSLWFKLAGASGALFCMTAVAWAAAGVGDQRHPMKAWLGKHGTTLIVVESLAVLVTTLLGMLLPEKERLPLEGDGTLGSRLPDPVDPPETDRLRERN